jgi:hypothetical protein
LICNGLVAADINFAEHQIVVSVAITTSMSKRHTTVSDMTYRIDKSASIGAK